MEWTKGQQIRINQNFTLSISIFNANEVAIISNNTDSFVKLSQTKVSKKLRKIKRLFRSHLSCHETFCFGWLSDSDILRVIDILK